MPSEIDYSRLPAHMQDGARRYVEQHCRVGSFLTAVLENDLVGAYSAADEENTAAMRDWAAWLYNECPAEAWGSPDKVTAWLARAAPPQASEGA